MLAPLKCQLVGSTPIRRTLGNEETVWVAESGAATSVGVAVRSTGDSATEIQHVRGRSILIDESHRTLELGSIRRI